jgi:hypothetical protein
MKIENMVRHIDGNFFQELSQSLLRIAKSFDFETEFLETNTDDVVGKEIRAKAEFAGYVARSVFEAELFIVGDGMP